MKIGTGIGIAAERRHEASPSATVVPPGLTSSGSTVPATGSGRLTHAEPPALKKCATSNLARRACISNRQCTIANACDCCPKSAEGGLGDSPQASHASRTDLPALQSHTDTTGQNSCNPKPMGWRLRSRQVEKFPDNQLGPRLCLRRQDVNSAVPQVSMTSNQKRIQPRSRTDSKYASHNPLNTKPKFATMSFQGLTLVRGSYE